MQTLFAHAGVLGTDVRGIRLEPQRRDLRQTNGWSHGLRIQERAGVAVAIWRASSVNDVPDRRRVGRRSGQDCKRHKGLRIARQCGFTNSYRVPCCLNTKSSRQRTSERFHATGKSDRKSPYRDTPIRTGGVHTLALIAGLPTGRKLKCVQIGANDGKINDPLFRISRQFADRTRLLLIEPQAQIIPYLRKNYDFHPDVRIQQVAIGDPGTLTLYGVRQEIWPDLDVAYAKNWPPYRAPSGIVSGDRAHVERWLTKHLPDPARIEDAVARFDVESVTLASLVDGWSEDGSTDLLQVDVEGLDDRVLMECDLERLRPKLIMFEAFHLPRPRKKVLFDYLERNGFVLARRGLNVLALQVEKGG